MQVVFDAVTKRYRRDEDPAVSGVSLAAAPGESVCLIGPSGAGKTTLFRLVTRTLVPDSGVVLVGGKDLGRVGYRALRALRRRIGVIHQRGDLVPASTVLTNVAIGAVGGRGAAAALQLSLRGATSEIARRAFQVLEELEIEPLAGARVDELSGGQRQRVAVARLLVQQPAVVVADEPTASVDPRSAQVVLDALQRLAAAGATLLLATHDLQVARRADRLVALREGRVIFTGAADALASDLVERVYAPGSALGPASAGPAADWRCS